MARAAGRTRPRSRGLVRRRQLRSGDRYRPRDRRREPARDAPVVDDFPLTMECEVVEVQGVAGEKRFIGRIANTVVDEAWI